MTAELKCTQNFADAISPMDCVIDAIIAQQTMLGVVSPEGNAAGFSSMDVRRLSDIAGADCSLELHCHRPCEVMQWSAEAI